VKKFERIARQVCADLNIGTKTIKSVHWESLATDADDLTNHKYK